MKNAYKVDTMYDAIIIGAGPAGLSAALYASRYNMKVLLLGELLGGVITQSIEVENYPGTKKATGMELMQKWKIHAEKFGAEIKQEKVIALSKENGIFKVKTPKVEYSSTAITIATGAKERQLGIPGEKEFHGNGVSQCPTCDGMFFSGKDVAVIGGGDAALRGAQVVLQYAKKLYLIHRRDEFRAEPIIVDKVKQNRKTKLVLGRTIKEIRGEDKVKEIVLDNDECLTVEGVFIEIGSTPNTDIVKKLDIELEEGYIKVNSDQSTNFKGIYAAGDVTNGSNRFRQVVTAAAEGAIAAQSMFEYNKKQ